MESTIWLDGLPEAEKQLEVVTERLLTAAQDGIAGATREFERELRADASQSRFTGSLQSGISSRLEGTETSATGLVVVESPSAKHAEFGRAVGRMPPLEVLREWVIRKTGDETLLYPIARAIAQKGTLQGKRPGIPRGWGHIRATIKVMRGRISDTLIRSVSRGLRDLGAKK